MLTIKEGQALPEISLRQYKDNVWYEVNTKDLFAEKTVIYGLPGAFTPTCQQLQTPSYEKLAPIFEELGVKNIVMTTVNDPFVTDAWRRELGVERVQFLADGNGDFAEAIGALVDKSELNFGKRSWRYAMVINQGKVEKLFVEPNEPGDPYGESAPETILEYLSPGHTLPKNVTVLTKFGCGFCVKAKDLLKEAGIEFKELQLSKDIDITHLQALSGTTTVPQVFIDGEAIGGSDKLEAWLQTNWK
jgi:glutaredoxin-like protein